MGALLLSIAKYLADILTEILRFVFNLVGISTDILETTYYYNASQFLFYNLLKVFLLLIIIIFVVAIIRSYFPPEKTKKFLGEGKRTGLIGNVLAALLGIVTPFCSCSAVPVFIGFVEAGVPLGVTFSFLISSPMVNEVALVMLWGMFGWQIASIYIATGVLVAIVVGIVIGKMHMEKYVEDYVYNIKSQDVEITTPTFKERIIYARDYAKEIIVKIWLYVFIGITISAIMHGWAPEGLLAQYAGRDNPFAVIVAVLVGVPLYSNAAGIIPIVSELTRLGVPMGTALAFMMAVIALSFPEMVMLTL